MSTIELFNQHNKTLVTITSVVLVILMSLIIAKAVLFFVEASVDNQITPGQNIAQPNKTANSQENYGLGQLNLFGSVEERAAPVVVDAPKTSLNLELQGIFTNKNPTLSSAIVAQKGKSGELFKIGDQLPGNAILNAVLDDHILLKRGSRIEKLTFPDSSLSQFSTPWTQRSNSRGRNSTTQPSNSARLQEVRDRIAKRSEEIARNRSSSKARGADFRKEINAYQERLDSDPQSVLNELGIVPVSKSDSKGYQIDSKISQTFLRQAGLRQGDVILSVNSRPVGNISNDKALISQAIAAKKVRVEVQRDSRRFFITVPIPQ
ncbi:MAG: type II secretion system protein N [bacterium]|nr:PDZ domain-containing protein [Gammaproteobacteria bacterium]